MANQSLSFCERPALIIMLSGLEQQLTACVTQSISPLLAFWKALLCLKPDFSVACVCNPNEYLYNKSFSFSGGPNTCSKDHPCSHTELLNFPGLRCVVANIFNIPSNGATPRLLQPLLETGRTPLEETFRNGPVSSFQTEPQHVSAPQLTREKPFVSAEIGRGLSYIANASNARSWSIHHRPSSSNILAICR